MFTPYHQSSAFHSEYLIQTHLQRNSLALTIQNHHQQQKPLDKSRPYGVRIKVKNHLPAVNPMSINVDKMDSKHDDSLQKPKPALKRRKKNSSTSDVSSDSLSPKKHVPNGFAEDYRSSPEITFNSSYHSILQTDPMNRSFNTSNGHQMNGSVTLKSPEHANYSSMMETSSQNGSIRSADSESPRHSSVSTHHFDDSDSASSLNKNDRRRQPRTPEDFYLFCQFILEYANYNEMCSQESLRSSTHSPLDSTGSATESTISSAANDESNHAISAVDSTKDLDVKDLDGSATILTDASSDDVTKAVSAIDVSSTNEDDDSDIDADSYNLITCYCGKPYAARPMIECSQCLTWLHLSCAKVKRKNIPDIFICVKCAKTSGQASVPLQSPSPSPSHPKDLQSNEPKENNRSRKSTASSTPQTRSDKLENNILQPLNVSAAYETGANNLENIKTTSTVSSIAVKYK